VTHLDGWMQMAWSNLPADVPRGMARRSNFRRVVIEVGMVLLFKFLLSKIIKIEGGGGQ
jgi:hypothetical protein